MKITYEFDSWEEKEEHEKAMLEEKEILADRASSYERWIALKQSLGEVQKTVEEALSLLEQGKTEELTESLELIAELADEANY